MNPQCATVEVGLGVTTTSCTDAYSGWLYFGAVISYALAALVLLWLCCIRERIAFTAMILSSVSEVLLQLPELILIQFVASLLVLGYALIWALAYFELMALCAASEWYTIALLNILAIFAFFWVQLVLVNISLVTTAGAVGWWYFSPAEATSRGCLLCRPAVCTPLLRACTLQLGSIALGSVLVAVVRTIIVVVKYIGEQAGNSSGWLKVAFCCCVCLLGCIERCIKWLTDYAFVYVAVYGTPFITSGMNVMGLLSTSGIGAIAQTTLVAPVLSMAAYLGAAIGGFLGYCALNVTGLGPAYIAVLIGAATGYVLTSIGLAPVDGGCKTLFVCYAESPKELADKSPALSAKLGEGAALSPAKDDGLARP